MSQTAHTITRPNVQRRAARGAPAGFRRIYAINLHHSRQWPPPGWSPPGSSPAGSPPLDLLSWIAASGFDTLLLALPRHAGTADVTSLPPIVDAANAAGLDVHLDLVLDVAQGGAAAVQEHPEWYQAVAQRPADPRQDVSPRGTHALHVPAHAAVDGFVGYWAGVLEHWKALGISGFRCRASTAVPPAVWRGLVAACDGLAFAGWTGTNRDLPGRDMPGRDMPGRDMPLPPGCFEVIYNSLAKWDFGAGWLQDELTRLAQIGPVANSVGLVAGGTPAMTRVAAERILQVASGNGHGLLVPIGFEFGLPSDPACPEHGSDDWQRLRAHSRVDLTPPLTAANRRAATRRTSAASTLRLLSSEDAAVAVLFESPGQLTLANRSLVRAAVFDPASVLPEVEGFAPSAPEPVALGPGEVRVITGSAAPPIRMQAPNLSAATTASRVAIEAVEPTVEAGRFAVKRVAGERVTVEADIVVDGHGKLAAALQWRAADETAWRESPMQLVANDRWSASFLLERVGRHVFRVIAWPDRYATWRDELDKKQAAGLNVTLELEEGRLLLQEIAPGQTIEKPQLASAATAAIAARADARPGRAESGEFIVDADRRAAEFSAWYELFPRNQSGDAARHGTFRDVIECLPAIRDMGFDVVYFPPIHPIGRTNRKGRDNTLTPAPDDPGSPYAIGAAEGGHEAIHPELGTLDDFRALRDAAAEHGLELALDFAIQCSPDHPWLREHPDWFDWRPDGGLRYAENPPKKYEDIVNVDFWRPGAEPGLGAVPGLWVALRDAVAYWAAEGVRIFRVDNPHTKPFAFWEWLIADIRAKWPETLFLSEAFTRPKVMYRLARLGFTQSYTYFTWRNEKAEIEEYLRELSTTVADFFRPHFFVNTPDINPTFLQHSGRPGFLIRAALAATLSGLWGMLQGFEFCEAEAVPGREEYAHSDKYELRARPQRAAGDIVDEITLLNSIRKRNPALHSHRGLAFHTGNNDQVLWFRKQNVDRSNVLLVAVCLDPFAPQQAVVEVPLWEWGLPDDAALTVTDLVHGGVAAWQGKYRTIALDPRTLPFAIWRARPLETAR